MARRRRCTSSASPKRPSTGSGLIRTPGDAGTAVCRDAGRDGLRRAEQRCCARVARRRHDKGSGTPPRARDRRTAHVDGVAGRNHGYRASDVAQLAALLDDAVGELRVAAGLPRIDLALVATASPLPPDVPAMPAPTLAREHRARVQGCDRRRGSSRACRPARGDRTDCAGVSRREGELGVAIHARARRRSCRRRSRLDRSYRDLVARTVTSADERAKRADVGGIERLVASSAQGRRSPRPAPSADDGCSARHARRPARRGSPPSPGTRCLGTPP